MLTPFDARSRPFQIGLRPLDPRHWTLPGADLATYLAEKSRLFTHRRDVVFAAERGTEAAQREVLARLATHLVADHPAVYEQQGTILRLPALRRGIDLDDHGVPALERAAMLVAEDLVLMRRGEDGWRLAAAALCFPSAWSLAEKFGRPMHEVHAPVPGFAAGTRNAALISRMFDSLRPETPMIRWNWSLFGDAALHHPEGGHADRPRFGDGTHVEGAVLRVERQTLTRLPESRDIVFTIGIQVDPLSALAEDEQGPQIASLLYEQIAGLEEEQLAYKGLARERELLLARLAELAARPAAPRTG